MVQVGNCQKERGFWLQARTITRRQSISCNPIQLSLILQKISVQCFSQAHITELSPQQHQIRELCSTIRPASLLHPKQTVPETGPIKYLMVILVIPRKNNIDSLITFIALSFVTYSFNLILLVQYVVH